MNEEFADQQETAPEDGQPEPVESEKFDTLPKPPQPDEGDDQAEQKEDDRA